MQQLHTLKSWERGPGDEAAIPDVYWINVICTFFFSFLLLLLYVCTCVYHDQIVGDKYFYINPLFGLPYHK